MLLQVLQMTTGECMMTVSGVVRVATVLMSVHMVLFQLWNLHKLSTFNHNFLLRSFRNILSCLVES